MRPFRLVLPWCVLVSACAAAPPEGMVRVPGGTVPAEEGLPAVTLDAFYMDRLPVTNAAWVAASRRPDAPGAPRREPSLPATSVEHADAEAYCVARGGRLPTDAELALAATAGEGYTSPWGGALDATRVDPTALGPLVPGLHPAGASPSGVEDLVGNVFHWTHTAVDMTGLQPSPELRGTLRVVRGGCCAALPQWNTSGFRTGVPQERSSYFLGFRCVRPVTEGADRNLTLDRPVPWARLDFAEATRQLLADLYGPRRDPLPGSVAALFTSLPAGASVADVGCGLGALTMVLARQVGPGGTAYAVDADASVLEFVAAAARAEGLPNVTPVHAAPNDTRLAPASVDLVLLFQMANSVGDEDLPAFTASLRQAVRPGGRIVVYEAPPFPPTRFLANMAATPFVLEAATEGDEAQRALWVFRAP